MAIHPKRKTLMSLLAIVITIVISISTYISYRNRQIERLYAAAVGYPGYSHGSEDSEAAVRQLATYHGRKSRDLVLAIALSEGSVDSQVQSEAFKVLSEQNDPEVGDMLANLLQLHKGLYTRQSAAKALQTLPCNDECMRSILHYLERIQQGELNWEDRAMRPANDSVTQELHKQQQELYAELYTIVRRNNVETLQELAEVYGLGSDAPSDFALYLVTRTSLPGSCPYILQSEQQISQHTPDTFKAPRQEVAVAIASLKCR